MNRIKNLNALEDRMARIDSGQSDHDEWVRLLRRWGKLNGLSLTRRLFGTRTLARLPRDNLGDKPFWRDHFSCFRSAGLPSAIVSELYGHDDNLQDTIDDLRPLGLMVHCPPNIRASFWYPGATMFLVVTRRPFRQIRWLPEQLDFSPTTSGRLGAEGNQHRHKPE